MCDCVGVFSNLVINSFDCCSKITECYNWSLTVLIAVVR